MWQETLPYDAGTLRHRIASGSPAQLQDMQEALEQRARELTAEIIALAVPDTDHRGSVPLSTTHWARVEEAVGETEQQDLGGVSQWA